MYSLLLLALNFVFGSWLKTYETVDLKNARIFFPEMRWDEFYGLKKPIDILIIGSSHAFRGFDPRVIREEIPSKDSMVFNFGSAAQSPVTSYFVLEEVLKYHRPKVVVMDVYVMVYTSDDQIIHGRPILSPMKWSENKKRYLMNGFSFDEKVKMLLFPTYVYRHNLKNKRNKLLGRKYIPKADSEYAELGFAFSKDTLPLDRLYNDNQFNRFEMRVQDITEKNIEYTNKIIDRCKELNIPLVWMNSPVPEHSTKQIKEFNDIYQYFNKWAAERKVPFYDFNIERIPALKDEFHYFDDDHMNYAGAKIFSAKAAEVLKKDGILNQK